MFSNECNGCSQGFWPVSSVTFQGPNVSYSRKSPSFRISDILHHVQNSGEYNRADYRGGSHLSFCQTPSALGPLQAFCSTKRVQCFVSSSPVTTTTTTATNRSELSSGCRQDSTSTENSKQLKFGINRILSNEFGKKSQEKENKQFRHISSSHSTEFGSSCGCGAPSCSFPLYTRITFPSPSLSAVHAIQPPHYPISPQSGVDSLPGPYSILNDETNMGGHSKRKRSWSRAVFSNLQRKGLEKRFEVQKYVTKPDRRQLAAMLGLTDAQVKVWFQNRRMKWRHAQQMKVKDVQNQSDIKDTDSDNEASDHDDVVLKNCEEIDSCTDVHFKSEDGTISEGEELYDSVDTTLQH